MASPERQMLLATAHVVRAFDAAVSDDDARAVAIEAMHRLAREHGTNATHAAVALADLIIREWAGQAGRESSSLLGEIITLLHMR